MSTRQLTLSQALEGFLLHARAARKSALTCQKYERILLAFCSHFQDDPPIAQITVEDVEAWFAQCRVSASTLYGYHTALSSFYSWAIGCRPALVSEHIMHRVERPRPEDRAIEPLSQADCRALMQAIRTSRGFRHYKASDGRETHLRRPEWETLRNEAILLALLDTGMRASELCGLIVNDLDMKNGTLRVFGKGSRERMVRLDDRSAQAIWRYLASRGGISRGEPLFATEQGNAIDRRGLYKLLRGLGERAGVADVHPHRFRHTFAIQYLRNGGNVYELKTLLGHEDLHMCLRYLKLAETDVQNGHRKASPVRNWRL